MSEQTLLRIKELCANKHISYRHLHHQTIPKESKAASHIRETSHEQGAKALILETKSKQLIQVILPAHKRISLKKLRMVLGEKNVSLTSPQRVLETTDCIIGSVPPLGILWSIPVYMDKSILENEEVVFSAGTLEDSCFIHPKDLLLLNDAIIVDVLEEEK